MGPQSHYPQDKHTEKAAYITCIDGRVKFSRYRNNRIEELASRHDGVFPYVVPGGALALLLDSSPILVGRRHVLSFLQLANGINPLTDVYLEVHMGCGAYGALAHRDWSEEEFQQEIAEKWADLDRAMKVAEEAGLPVDIHLNLAWVDGTSIPHP